MEKYYNAVCLYNTFSFPLDIFPVWGLVGIMFNKMRDRYQNYMKLATTEL